LHLTNKRALPKNHQSTLSSIKTAKNTSSGKASIIGLVIKSIIGLGVILGIIFFLSTIDFPAPKKEIEKIIPNENFKIVK
jgi:hypothetical protein